MDTNGPDAVENLAFTEIELLGVWRLKVTWDWPDTSFGSGNEDLAGTIVWENSVGGTKADYLPYEGVASGVWWATLDANSPYTYYLQTIDVAGNLGTASTIINGTTGDLDLDIPEADTTPPASPSGLVVTTDFRRLIDGHIAYADFSWTANAEADMAGYILYIREDGETDWQSWADISSSGDTAVRLGGFENGAAYDWALSAYDTSLNESNKTEYASNPWTAGDNNVPDAFAEGDWFATEPTYSDFYTNGDLITLNSQVFTVTFYFQVGDNTDSLRITQNDSPGGMAAANFTASTLVETLDTSDITPQVSGDGSGDTIVWTWTGRVASNTTWLFFDPVNKAGVKRSDSAGTPWYIRITTDGSAIDTRGTKFEIVPAPNELGWHKANFDYRASPVVEAGGPGISVWYNSEDGEDWQGPNLGGGYVTFSTETSASGVPVEAYVTLSDNTNTNASSFIAKLDKTSPTAPSITAANVVGAIKVAITPGSDAHSGLRSTSLLRNTTNDSGSATEIIRTDPNTSEWVDKTVEPGITYYYWARHYDRADNSSSLSTVSSTTNKADQFFGATNFVRNSSFETLTAGSSEFQGWERGDQSASAGSYLSSVDAYHGDNCVELTATQTIIQRGLPVFPGAYYGLTFYHTKDTASARTARVTLEFKSVDGTVVQTHTLDSATAASQGSWVRMYESGADWWTFGPTGGDTFYTYPSTTHSVDITLSSPDGASQFDAVMWEELYTPDGGTTWKNRFTDSLFPDTPYFETRVENLDLISAWIGRFAQIYADNITAGRVQSQDGLTYLDLDDAKLVGDHTAQTGYETDYTTIDDSGVYRTIQGTSSTTDKVWQAPMVRRHKYILPDVSGAAGTYTWTATDEGDPLSVFTDAEIVFGGAECWLSYPTNDDGDIRRWIPIRPWNSIDEVAPGNAEHGAGYWSMTNTGTILTLSGGVYVDSAEVNTNHTDDVWVVAIFKALFQNTFEEQSP